MNFQYQIWQNLNTVPVRYVRIEKIEANGISYYKVSAYYQNDIPVTAWTYSGYFAKVIVDNYAMNLFANGWSLLEVQREED